MSSISLRTAGSRRSASAAVLAPSEIFSGSPRCREPIEKCIAGILRDAGGAGVTKNELTRQTQFVGHRRRNAVLAGMIEAGEIVAIRQATATKSAIILRLANTGEAERQGAAPELALAAGDPPIRASILALDLGQKTGWAVRNGDGAIASGVQEFRPGRFEGGGMIWLRFRSWLQEVDDTSGGVGVVVFEEVRRHLGTSASHVYGGFLAHLTAWAEANKIPYQGVPVGTIKRHVTGKGNADKQAVIAAVKALGFDPQDDNEADALAILHWAMANRVGFGATVAPVAPRKRGEQR